MIHWNQYSEEEKRAVLSRIDQLTSQIMASRFRVSSVAKLQETLDDFRFFYDSSLSPYCWLHNLLQKRMHRISNLEELGVELLPEYTDVALQQLIQDINDELFILSEAHFERYFDNYRYT